MVLHGAVQHDGQEDDDEYVFEEDEEVTLMSKRWLSVARFISGKDFYTRAICLMKCVRHGA